MPTPPKVLIVDDDSRMCDSMTALLSSQDYILEARSSGKGAIDSLSRDTFDLVLLDMMMPDMNGYQIMDHINKNNLEPLVIVITGHVTTESAIGSLRRGAYDYIRKPFEPEELLMTIKNSLDYKRLKAENEAIHSELALSEKRYRFLIQNSPDIIYTLDHSGNFTFISDAAERLLNYQTEELIGKHYSVIVHPADLERAKWVFAERRTGDRAASGVELKLIAANGDDPFKLSDAPHLTIELKSNGMYDRPTTATDKTFLGTHGVARDINERKQLEYQLRSAQRMEALGTLAGGISHDFNNLLTGIQGRASIVLMDTDDTHRHFEHLKAIENYVNSAANLTKQLLAFARGGKYEAKPTDMNHLIQKTSEMFGRTKKEITIHIKSQKGIWAVEVDRNQIEQIMLNLYVNAWQCMPTGGDLYLETENVTLDADLVRGYNLAPGNYVKFSITDTGVGMDQATQERIFEPFFTTKEMGRGTGLGLASAYGIVKNHGGIIDVYSEKDRGSTFCIYLPASEKEAVYEEKLETDIYKGAETILIVDDEDIVLKVSKELLKRLGYKVLSAESGSAAIELFEANQDEIDMVILDMIMPGMGGRETFERLRQINSEVKVLLSSGYSINGQATEILEQGCDGFLQKPFTTKELSQKIREILGKHEK